MSDLGVLYFTEQHIKEIKRGYEAVIEVVADVHKKDIAAVEVQRDTLRATLQQVVACFKSRAESSTCIEDHHPSCLAFIESKLKEIT